MLAHTLILNQLARGVYRPQQFVCLGMPCTNIQRSHSPILVNGATCAVRYRPNDKRACNWQWILDLTWGRTFSLMSQLQTTFVFPAAPDTSSTRSAGDNFRSIAFSHLRPRSASSKSTKVIVKSIYNVSNYCPSNRDTASTTTAAAAAESVQISSV